MHKEKRKLLKHVINPIKGINIFCFIVLKIMKKIIEQFARPITFYPKLVKISVSKKYMDYKISTTILPKYLDFSLMEKKHQQEMRPFSAIKLKLAVDYISIQVLPEWNILFDDEEQLVSLHRWGWLLHLIVDEPEKKAREVGRVFIQDWCSRISKNLSNPIFQSYTMSERVCNSIIFAQIMNVTLMANVKQSMEETARLIAERIEYTWLDGTGNHVINNARALYFAGQYFKVPSYVCIAKAVLSTELYRLIDRNGFLREGSSHYQFLITRWLLELAWYAKLHKDEELLTIFKPVLPGIISSCWFFIIESFYRGEYSIPLIGDVSPDFTWSWLIDLLWSDLALYYYQPPKRFELPNIKGWGMLFGRKPIKNNFRLDDVSDLISNGFSLLEFQSSQALHNKNHEKKSPNIQNETKLNRSNSVDFKNFSESGWYRLDWQGLTIIWHVEPKGSPRFASHGHCDTGSFCLYWNGLEILVDPGRLNYKTNDLIGLSGVTASAHNNLTLDGHDPFVYFNRFHYPDFYVKHSVDVQFKQQGKVFVFSIEHSGFSRLGLEKIIYRRNFYISFKEIHIEDCLSGKNTHSIETYFQWAPALSLKLNAKKNKWDVICRESGVIGSFSSFDGSTFGSCSSSWYFPNYGQQIHKTTLQFNAMAKLPFTRRYVLKLD